jgi:hypothetical protein
MARKLPWIRRLDDGYRRCVANVEIDSVGGLGADVVGKAPTMAEIYEFGR